MQPICTKGSPGGIDWARSDDGDVDNFLDYMDDLFAPSYSYYFSDDLSGGGSGESADNDDEEESSFSFAMAVIGFKLGWDKGVEDAGHEMVKGVKSFALNIQSADGIKSMVGDAASNVAYLMINKDEVGENFISFLQGIPEMSAYDLGHMVGNFGTHASVAYLTGTFGGAAFGALKFAKTYETSIGLTANMSKVKYIGRLEDLKGIPRSQTLLNDLPNLGSPKANYYQNMSVLRKAIRDGYTIKDASKFRPNSQLAPTIKWPTRTVGQTFLGAERLLLKNRGLWP